jgi:hypothetical protein
MRLARYLSRTDIELSASRSRSVTAVRLHSNFAAMATWDQPAVHRAT